jgi:hypothetical protein
MGAGAQFIYAFAMGLYQKEQARRGEPPLEKDSH